MLKTPALDCLLETHGSQQALHEYHRLHEVVSHLTTFYFAAKQHTDSLSSTLLGQIEPNPPPNLPRR